MKKCWGKPIVQVQLFVPQECVAACQLITNVRYLDYKRTPRLGFLTITYDFGYHDSGEDFNNGYSTSSSVEVGPHYDVDGYNSYDNRVLLSDPYTGASIKFPLVEIRREGSGDGTRYAAYNATS